MDLRKFQWKCIGFLDSGLVEILHGCEVMKGWSNREGRVRCCLVHVFRNVRVVLSSEVVGWLGNYYEVVTCS